MRQHPQACAGEYAPTQRPQAAPHEILYAIAVLFTRACFVVAVFRVLRVGGRSLSSLCRSYPARRFCFHPAPGPRPGSCGEDKKGVKLWDLKSRQRHELLEKDGAYLDDPYGDDEDVFNNELKDDDYYYGDSKDSYDNQFDDEDDDEEDDDEEEKDDIEEELLFGNGYDVDEEDDDDEDGYDDDEELTIKQKKK